MPRNLTFFQAEDLVTLVTEEPPGSMGSRVVVYGTGGGKTIVAQSYATVCFALRRYTHIIITCPQQQIRDQAVHENDVVNFRGQHERLGLQEDELPLMPVVVGDKDKLFEFLADPNPGYILSVCHQLLLTHRETVARRLSELQSLLIVDEAHVTHWITQAPDGEPDREGTHLAAFCQQLLRSGRDVMKLTATPYRSDVRQVINREQDLVVERSMAFLILHGFAPGHIESEVVEVPGKGIDDNESRMIPVEVEHGVPMLVDRWEQDCLPTIIRVIPRKAEVNRRTLRVFNDAFESAIERQELPDIEVQWEGSTVEVPHVVDATNTEGHQRLQQALNAEKEGTDYRHYDRIRRVILAHNRMTEGVDSPCRCQIYFWGIPTSLQVLIQSIGRTLRLRTMRHNPREPLHRGYPTEWLDRSRIVFFVATENASFEHSQTLLRAIALMDSFEQAGILRDLLTTDDGMTGEISQGDEETVDVMFRRRYIDSTTLARRARVLWDDTADPRSDAPTLHQLEELAVAIAEAENYQEWNEVLEPADDDPPVFHRPSIRRALIQQRRDILESQIVADMVAQSGGLAGIDWDSLFQEFQDTTMTSDTTHCLNGENIKHFSRSLQAATDRPATVQEVLDRWDRYRQETQSIPQKNDLDIFHRNTPFSTYHHVLTHGLLDRAPLPGGLYRLILENRCQDPWGTIRQVLAQADGQANAYLSENRSSTDWFETAKILGTNIPEVVYFPQALRMARRFGARVEALSVYQAVGIYNQRGNLAHQEALLEEALNAQH